MCLLARRCSVHISQSDKRRRMEGAMNILVGLLLLCAAWSVAASVLIVRELDKRGVQVSLISMRLMLFNYIKQYIEITRREQGRIGPLFYHYVAPINAALVVVILLVLIAA